MIPSASAHYQHNHQQYVVPTRAGGGASRLASQPVLSFSTRPTTPTPPAQSSSYPLSTTATTTAAPTSMSQLYVNSRQQQQRASFGVPTNSQTNQMNTGDSYLYHRNHYHQQMPQQHHHQQRTLSSLAPSVSAARPPNFATNSSAATIGDNNTSLYTVPGGVNNSIIGGGGGARDLLLLSSPPPSHPTATRIGRGATNASHSEQLHEREFTAAAAVAANEHLATTAAAKRSNSKSVALVAPRTSTTTTTTSTRGFGTVGSGGGAVVVTTNAPITTTTTTRRGVSPSLLAGTRASANRREATHRQLLASDAMRRRARLLDSGVIPTEEKDTYVNNRLTDWPSPTRAGGPATTMAMSTEEGDYHHHHHHHHDLALISGEEDHPFGAGITRSTSRERSRSSHPNGQHYYSHQRDDDDRQNEEINNENRQSSANNNQQHGVVGTRSSGGDTVIVRGSAGRSPSPTGTTTSFYLANNEDSNSNHVHSNAGGDASRRQGGGGGGEGGRGNAMGSSRDVSPSAGTTRESPSVSVSGLSSVRFGGGRGRRSDSPRLGGGSAQQQALALRHREAWNSDNKVPKDFLSGGTAQQQQQQSSQRSRSTTPYGATRTRYFGELEDNNYTGNAQQQNRSHHQHNYYDEQGGKRGDSNDEYRGDHAHSSAVVAVSSGGVDGGGSESVEELRELLVIAQKERDFAKNAALQCRHVIEAQAWKIERLEESVAQSEGRRDNNNNNENNNGVMNSDDAPKSIKSPITTTGMMCMPEKGDGDIDTLRESLTEEITKALQESFNIRLDEARAFMAKEKEESLREQRESFQAELALFEENERERAATIEKERVETEKEREAVAEERIKAAEERGHEEVARCQQEIKRLREALAEAMTAMSAAEDKLKDQQRQELSQQREEERAQHEGALQTVNAVVGSLESELNFIVSEVNWLSDWAKRGGENASDSNNNTAEVTTGDNAISNSRQLPSFNLTTDKKVSFDFGEPIPDEERTNRDARERHQYRNNGEEVNFSPIRNNTYGNAQSNLSNSNNNLIINLEELDAQQKRRVRSFQANHLALADALQFVRAVNIRERKRRLECEEALRRGVEALTNSENREQALREELEKLKHDESENKKEPYENVEQHEDTEKEPSEDRDALFLTFQSDLDRQRLHLLAEHEKEISVLKQRWELSDLKLREEIMRLEQSLRQLESEKDELHRQQLLQQQEQADRRAKETALAADADTAAASELAEKLLLLRDRDLEIEDLNMLLTEANAKRASDEEEIASLESQLIETRARLSAIECAMETMITLGGKEEQEEEQQQQHGGNDNLTKAQEGEEEEKEREKEHLRRLLALERAAHQQAREEINRLIDSAAVAAADAGETNKRETSTASAVTEANGTAMANEGEVRESKNNWEDQIQEFEAIIKQQQQQAEEIEEERRLLVLSLKQKEETISSLEMAISDASRSITEAETALNASEEIRSSLGKQVAELSVEIKDTRDENEKQQQQQQQQQVDKGTQEQEGQELEQQQERCSELESKIKLLHSQIEEKDAEISHFVRIIEDHDSMCTTLHTHIASLEDNEQKLTSEMLSTVAPLRESVAELQRSNEEAQHKALIASEALESALKQVEAEREAAKREKDELEAIFKTEKEKEFAAAALALASLTAKKEGLESEVRKLRDRVSELDERLVIETQQKERLEALNADAASTAASVQLLEQNIFELKEALNAEKDKVAVAESGAQSLRSVCENTIAQLDVANAAAAAAAAAAASAQQAQREKEELRAKNDAVALAELTSKSARLETDVFELREALAEAEARLKTVKSEADSHAEERRTAEIQIVRETLGAAHVQELASLESEWQARLATAESRHAGDTLKKVESLSESHTIDVKLLTDQLLVARDNLFTLKSELDAARKLLTEKEEASQRDEAKQRDDNEAIAAREKENQSLLLAVAEKDEAILRLESEMKDLLQQKISSAAQLTDESAKHKERADKQERRAHHQQNAITELEERLLEQERRFAAECEALVSNLDASHHEKEMTDLVEKHKAEISALSFSKANVDGALEAMRREKEAVEVAHNQTIEDLRRKFAEEDAANGSLITDLTSKLSLAEQESAVNVEAARQEAESKMQALTADLERTIESQRNLLAERDEALLFLQNEMDAIKERVRVREETAARNRAAEVSQQESDLSLITKQKGELESDVKSLSAKIESLTKAIESTTELRESESSALTKLKQELEEASAEIAASRERALAAEEHSLELQQEIHALSRANEAIEAQFAAEVERNALAAVAAHDAKETSSNLLLDGHDSSDYNNNSTSTATLSTSESNGFQKDEGSTPPDTPSEGGRGGHSTNSADDPHATAAAVAELLREVEAKNSEIAGLNAIVGELRDEFHRLHTQLRAVEDEDEVQKERIAELTEQLVEVEFDRDQLSDKLASAARASSPSAPARVQDDTKETHSMAEKSAPTVHTSDRVVELERAVVDLVAEKAVLEEALRTAQKERDELLTELEYAAVAVEEHLNASPGVVAASSRHVLAKSNLDVGHLEVTNNNVDLQSPVAGNGNSTSPNSILSPAPQAPPSHSSDCDFGKKGGHDPDFGEVVESAFQTHNDFVVTQLQPSYLGEEF